MPISFRRWLCTGWRRIIPVNPPLYSDYSPGSGAILWFRARFFLPKWVQHSGLETCFPLPIPYLETMQLRALSLSEDKVTSDNASSLMSASCVRCGWVSFVLFLTFFLAGCATENKALWNSRIGGYTFDQAVKEYGPPDKSAELTTGTKVCEWLLEKGTTQGTYLSSPYAGSGLNSVYTSSGPDFFLRLTFDKDGKLLEWKQLAK